MGAYVPKLYPKIETSAQKTKISELVYLPHFPA